MRHILLFCLSIYCFQGLSQNIVKIKGKIIGDDHKSVSNASISILSPKDSIFIYKGFNSDTMGAFSINLPKVGDFILKIHKIGYTTLFIKKTDLISLKTALTIDTIILHTTSIHLNEVLIKSNRPFIERSIDHINVNVDGNVLYKGDNVLDVLKMVPGVIIDSKDNVQIFGNSSITFMINNRPVKMSGESLKLYLKTQLANDITKIEIATNPSSKYDAQGTAGIINIVQKKTTENGLKGSIYSSYAYSGYNNGYLAPEFTIKKNRTILNFDLGLSTEPEVNWVEENRLFLQSNSRISQKDTVASRKKSVFTSFALSQQLTKRSVLGLELGYSSLRKPTNKRYLSTLDSGLVSTTSQTIEKSNTNTNNPYIGLYFHSDKDTLGSRFDINVDGWSNQIKDQRDITSSKVSSIFEKIADYDTDNTHIVTFKADYTKIYKNQSKFAVGIKSSLIDDKYLLNYTTLNSNLNSIIFGGSFNYKENINATYIDYTFKKWKNWQLQSGLRLENTNTESRLNNSENKTNKKYLNLFPSLFIQRDLNINFINQINFSYSSRINRPRLGDLNPINIYNNPYSFFTGNVDLRPELVNKFEIALTFYKKYSISSNYEIHQHTISGVSYPYGTNNTDIYYNSSANLNHYKTLINSFNIPFEYKILNLNAAFIWTYNDYYSVLANQQIINNKKNDFFFNLSGSLQFPRDLVIRFQSFYKSPFALGQQTFNHRTNTTIGVVKTWTEKIILSFNLEDPFYINNEKFSIKDLTQIANINNKWDSRKITISLTYLFKSGNKFNKKNFNKGNWDEVGRK